MGSSRPSAAVALLAGITVLAGASSLRAQSVDAVVTQALRAKGGLERVRQVTGLVMRGTIKANGFDMPVVITTLRPHFFRQELKAEGTAVVQAFDGETAWVSNPMAGTGVQTLPDEQARRMREQADFDGPFVDTARKGITIAYDKLERIEGRSANCVRITRPTGPVQRLCLDADTGLEMRSSVELEEEGRKVRVDTLFADYRTVDGLTLPFRVRTLVDGKPQSLLIIDGIDVSPSTDPKLFRKP